MPPAKAAIQEFPLTFEGGLVTEVEDSTLEVGQAASLVNWEPTAQGGLRARNAWTAISTTGLPTNYKVRGWGTIATDASAAGGGGGTATIVQTDSIQTDNGIATGGGTESVSLTGITIGNLLVVGFTLSDTSSLPSVGSITAGFTLVAASAGVTSGANDGRSFIYARIATSTSHTCQVTAAGSGVPTVTTLAMSEVSGVSSATATDTDTQAGSAALTATCASVSGSGVAVTVWDAFSGAGGSWTTTPGSGYTNWGAAYFDGSSAMNSDLNIKTYTSSPVTDTGNSLAGDNASMAMAIFDAAAGGGAVATAVEYYIVLAVATDTGYSLYRILRDEITTGTWTLIDSGTADDTSVFVSMAQGAGYLAWSASSMTQPRKILISGPTGSNITGMSGNAGRALAYHKDRLFIAGDEDTPSRLYFSGIGTPDSFATSTDYLDIGGDDGEAIQDLVSVEGLLLVCKTSRLYLISGSGIESFFVNELSGGSAASGRAAVRTPYGTVVVGPTDIWVVQGGGVDPLSRPLGAAFSVVGNVSTAYAQDHVLVCDTDSNVVHRVNLVTGAWLQEEVTNGANEPHHLFSLQGRLYYGVGNSATEAGGTRRLSDPRSYDFITGGTSFEASTGKLALLGPSVTYTPRHLFLQVRNHDDELPNALHVTVTTDLGSQSWADMIDAEVKRYRVDLGQHTNASWLQIAFAADSSAIAGALDPERAVLSTYVDSVR